MSIALYDDDFRRYVHVPFNLELMKLATYYKRKNEIVVLTPSIQKDRYSTTFLLIIGSGTLYSILQILFLNLKRGKLR